MNHDPNADLEHTNESRYGAGGDCLTCGVKWPCPTVARRMAAAPTGASEDYMPPICPDCRTDDDGESYVCDPALTLCPLNRRTAAPTGPDPRTDAAVET